jgi:hypothetical protein
VAESSNKPRNKFGQSSVTNGTALHVGAGDKRNDYARRFSDIVRKLTAKHSGWDPTGHLELGGEEWRAAYRDAERAAWEKIDEEQRGVIRRIAGMTIEAEKIEAKIAGGETIDHEAYGQLSDRLNRAFRALEYMNTVVEPVIEDRVVSILGVNVDLRFEDGLLDIEAMSDDHLAYLNTVMNLYLAEGKARTRPYRKADVMSALTHPPKTNDGEIEIIDPPFDDRVPDEIEEAIRKLF